MARGFLACSITPTAALRSKVWGRGQPYSLASFGSETLSHLLVHGRCVMILYLDLLSRRPYFPQVMRAWGAIRMGFCPGGALPDGNWQGLSGFRPIFSSYACPFSPS